jgi:hypothetical protein
MNGETLLAVTAHTEGETGVCFRTYLTPGRSSFSCWLWADRERRGQDGDVTEHNTHDRPRHDIGADTVDYRMLLDSVFLFRSVSRSTRYPYHYNFANRGTTSEHVNQ